MANRVGRGALYNQMWHDYSIAGEPPLHAADQAPLDEGGIELRRVGAGVHLAEPAETAARRGHRTAAPLVSTATLSMRC